ncbi:hypothetical protein PoB_006810100 [Plakobranchus ocellatus]|uniref:Uncharacterized protein n=1 Tax=Plakobranchus ocellatus TaxID=259542 RepID=A0AAV4DCE8_9GAST|nr:hypothetical protein PoB_006810100 [Plakobranchus ocellatus]
MLPCSKEVEIMLIELSPFSNHPRRCRIEARLVWFLIASQQQGDLRLLGPPSGQGAGARLEPATERSYQISVWMRHPLWHQCSPKGGRAKS